MINFLTSQELMSKLGESIKQIRLLRDITRKTLSESAGIGMNALKNLERGEGSSLSTLTAVLIALERADWFDSLSPQISINPLKMVRGKKTKKS